MSTATANPSKAAAPAKPKSKSRLFILIGVVVLALIGAGGAFFILKKNTALDEDSEEASHSAQDKRANRTPPTFLPLEAMVVNLADAGGNRFAQLGITLQVEDAQTAEAMKAFMPRIRNGILMLISQRTSESMLQIEGKEKLSADIVREVSQVMGFPVNDASTPEDNDNPTRKRRVASPLQAVLFSSFIVQ